MDFLRGINWLAVLAATVAAFLLGGLWFSVIFRKAWMEALGLPKDQPMGNPGAAMGISFVTTFVMAATLAAILYRMPETSCPGALRLGLAIGCGIVLMGMISDYSFTGWSKKLLWIQGSYHVVMVTLMAGVIWWMTHRS